MTVQLSTIPVGPWPMNSYLIVANQAQEAVLVDPGADPVRLLTFLQDLHIQAIVITHGHPDHTGALEEVRAATGAPVYIHPADAEQFDIRYDHPLEDGKLYEWGGIRLRAIHTPGHTPGATCLDLVDGRVLVGDTLFVGGPGRTQSPEDFETTLHTLQHKVFTWPGQWEFFPGHGHSGKIGEERAAFNAFVERGWPADLHGDVTWDPPQAA